MGNFRSEIINIKYFPLNIDVINANKQFMSEITLRAWNSSSELVLVLSNIRDHDEHARKAPISSKHARKACLQACFPSMLDVLLDRLDGPLRSARLPTSEQLFGSSYNSGYSWNIL